MPADDAIDALREAVRLAPDNAALRAHLAATLLRAGMAGEAEAHYRFALTDAPADTGVQLGLAQAFYAQGKTGEALVLVERLAADAVPAAHVLHARLLLAAGEDEDAAAAYRRAVEADPALADAELAVRLGVTAQPHEIAEEDDPDVVEGKVRVRSLDEPDGRVGEIERPEITFADVGGMEPVKDEIRLKIILPLQQPELFKAYGKPVGGGILLFGPPGCGKTHLARATAGEVGATFLSVGLQDVLDMWLGNSERNLHEVFAEARRRVPAVLFFDEVDALGASRGDLRGSAGRNVVNQFLAELDGVDTSNEGVLILAATNAPWHLDTAFRRPGRFDRVVFVPPPDEAARAAILEIHLRGKPVAGVDAAAVAKRTADYSGADLKAVVDAAVEDRLRDALRSGKPEPLTTADLRSAAKRVKPSTREWFGTARNYALYANAGGAYDDVLAYIEGRR